MSRASATLWTPSRPMISLSRPFKHHCNNFWHSSRAVQVQRQCKLYSTMGSDSFEWVDPNQCQSGSAYQAILKGSRPAVDIPASQYIDRPEAIEKVMKLLEDPIPRRYNIVTGPAGSGKTTTIKKACSLVGQGVIYVHLNAVTIKSKTYLVPIINTDATFQHIRGLVAEALNIKESYTEETKELQRLQAYLHVEHTLHQAATEYKAKHNTPMRLVLDNLDSLQRPRDTVVIKRLQEFARQCAEQDLVSVVFAFGPGDMLETMQKDVLGWSRSGRILVMPELSNEQAMEYARQLGVPEKHVDQLVALVGGNFGELDRYGGLLHHGESWADVESAIYSAAKKQYGTVNLLPGDYYGKSGLDEFATQTLLALQQLEHAQGSAMSFVDFTDLLPPIPGQLEGFNRLHNNKIVASYNGHTVVFASKAMACYLKLLLKAHKMPDL